MRPGWIVLSQSLSANGEWCISLYGEKDLDSLVQSIDERDDIASARAADREDRAADRAARADAREGRAPDVAADRDDRAADRAADRADRAAARADRAALKELRRELCGLPPGQICEVRDTLIVRVLITEGLLSGDAPSLRST